MKYGITSVAIILALFLSPANAHPRHYRHHTTNPMIGGLGTGLLFMLQHKNADPRHEWHDVWGAPDNTTIPRKQPMARVERSGALPGPCRQAARMGGPCGCWAEYTLFGRLEHVVNGWNAWLASAWLPSGGHSQRVNSVFEANAAVYVGRKGGVYHVAPVIGGVAHDYFGDHPIGGNVVLVRATI